MTKYRETPRAQVDGSPRLEGSFLLRQGFKDKDTIKLGLVSYNLWFFVEKQPDGMLYIYTPSEIGILYQEIDFSLTLNGATWKPYFFCPVIEDYCSTIYFHSGVWASRDAHRIRSLNLSPHQQKGRAMGDLRDAIRGTSVQKPARGARRRELLSEVKAELDLLGILPNTWIDLEPEFEREGEIIQRSTRRQERSRRPQETTLGYAIQCGRMANHDAEVVRYRTSGVVPPSTPNIGHAARAERPLAALEDYPCIDLKTIRARGWLDAGYLVAWHLRWPAELCESAEILMFIDMRSDPALYFEFSKKGQPPAYHQGIPIVSRSTMPGRSFLRCPVLGTEHQQLFLRDGYFASQAAHRLQYRSQF